MDGLNSKTLIEPVIARAKSAPESPVYCFLEDQNNARWVSAGEFHLQNKAYASALQASGVGPDDLVILVLQHSVELLSAFWGALYLGAVASIFPFLTEKLDAEIYMQRVHTLVAHEHARVVITFPEFKDQLSELLSDVDCRILSTAEVPLPADNSPEPTPWDGTADKKLAFLQHSSGTTGLQKGVALTHRAVLEQIRAYGQAIHLNQQDVIVSWLPLYHDMGLIAGFVMPIVAGVPLVLMSPFQWVRNPKILLQAVDRFGGTLCWLPNFAYNHLARVVRPRDLEGLNLGSLRAVINCSEPVRLDSHQRFLQRFNAYGLHEEMLATCYAMAENTFAVTQSPLGAPPTTDWIAIQPFQVDRVAIPADAQTPGAMPVVSCGKPIPGVEVRAVDEAGNLLPERRVGELILRGPSMLDGYYQRPDLTAQAIRDGWYYTGDMGYIADGEVYVSGRKKDMIIVGGKNVYPQDLEDIANTVEGVHPGRAVAFGLMDEDLGSEVVIMVCELENPDASPEEMADIERALRQRIARQTEIALGDLRLVGRHWLIKTSSGKTARNDNRMRYLEQFRGNIPS